MDFANLLTEWYARWTALPLDAHLTNMVGGLIGAVIFCAWTMPVIRLPEFDKKNHELRLNSVGLVVVGVFIAWLVDTHFVLSLLGGFLGPKLAEVTVNTVLPGVGRALVRYTEAKAGSEGSGQAEGSGQWGVGSGQAEGPSARQEYGYYGGGYAAYNRESEEVLAPVISQGEKGSGGDPVISQGEKGSDNDAPVNVWIAADPDNVTPTKGQ